PTCYRCWPSYARSFAARASKCRPSAGNRRSTPRCWRDCARATRRRHARACATDYFPRLSRRLSLRRRPDRMLLMVLGLSHKTAPLALLERAVFSPEALPTALATLREQVANAVILSTCNRVEVYALVGHPDSGRRALLRYLSDYHGLRLSEL